MLALRRRLTVSVVRLLIVAILAQALCPGMPVPAALAASRPAAPAQRDEPVSLPDGALPAQVLGQAASLSAAVERPRLQRALNSGQFLFIENVGQFDAQARFRVRGAGVTDTAHGVVVNPPGLVHIAGGTQSSNFPVSTGAYSTTRSGPSDAFVAMLATEPLSDEFLLTLCPPLKGGLPSDTRTCCILSCNDMTPVAGDPVNTRTGAVDHTQVDLSFPALGGQMTFQRSYSSHSEALGVYTAILGTGWTHNHDIRLITETQAGGDPGLVKFKAQGASRLSFYQNVLTDTFTAYGGVQAELVKTAAGGYVLTTTQQMVYTFDELGLVQTWSDGKGHTWTYTYDAYQRLTRVEDSTEERYLTFTYYAGTGNPRLQRVTDPLGRYVEFTYDGDDLVAVRDALGQTWTYEYAGSSHRLAQVLDPQDGTVVWYHYDAQGRVDQQGDGSSPTSPQLTLSYARTAGHTISGTTTIQDALGQRTVITYNVRGTLARQTDALGHTTTKDFNGVYRPERLWDGNGNGTGAAWSVDGAELLQVTDAQGYTTTLAYDARHQVTQTMVAGRVTGVFTYSGTLLTRQADALGQTSVYTYSEDNLLVATQDPLGHVTGYGYDDLGNRVVVTDALGHTTRYAYDLVGRLITTTGALGQATVNIYDDGDRLVQVTRNYLESQPQNYLEQYNLITRYQYDVRGQAVLVTDTLGYVTRTEYDPAGRPVTVTQNYTTTLGVDPNQYNVVTTTGYDAAGRPVTVTDTLGHITVTTYDAQGRVVAVTRNYVNGVYDPAHPDEDVRTTTAYDAVGNVISQTDALGYITRTWYDELNRPISTTQNYLAGHGQNYQGQYNLVTWYEYDYRGNVVTQTDTLGRIALTQYDDVNRPVQVTQNYSATHPAQNYLNEYNLVTLTAYDAAGNVISRTDTLGHVAYTEYDALNRPVTVTQNYRPGYAQNYLNQYNLVMVTAYDALGNRAAVTDTLGHVTEYTPDALGRVVTVTRYLTDSAQPPVGTPVSEVTHYDVLGRRMEALDALGHATTYGYDALGRTAIVTDATGYTRTTTYNALGWVTAQYDGLGRATTFTYDGLGRLLSVTDPLEHTTSYAYDAQGRRVSLTDANGIVTHYAYDALGRLAQVTENYIQGGGTDDETNVVTRYSYDVLGNRTALVNGRGYTTTYTYDTLSRLLATSDPLTHTTRYAYDALGHRTVLTDANGEVTRYTYDAAGRLTVISYTAHSGQWVEYAYDALRHRLSMVDATDTTEYNYDDLFRVTAVETTHGITREVEYGYDLAGNRVRLAYPGGQVVTYAYDDANRLVSVRDWDEQTTSYAYDRAGQLITTTLPNGVVTVSAYDAAGRLAERTHTRGADRLGRYVFAVDAVGNRTAVTETLWQPTGATITDTAAYSIAASADDASVHQVGDGSWTTTTTGNTLTVGQDGVPASVTDVAGLRFTGIDLPTGAAVTQAVLNVTASGVPGQAGTTQMHVYGEAADAAAAYSTSENFAWRELTAASADWAIDPWASGTSYNVDVTAVVSEVVARSGWEDGNPVALQITPVITGVVQPWSYDGSVTRTARLAVTYTVPGMEVVTTTLAYAYDPLQRLTGATATGDHAAWWTFTYDAVGNRTQYVRAVGGTAVTTTYTYDAANRLATQDGQPIFAWDDNGNLLDDGTQEYSYDQANRLIAVTGAALLMTYDYNGDTHGGRVLAMDEYYHAYEIAYTLDLVAPLEQVLETANSAEGTVRYLYGNARIGEQTGGTWSYHLTDGLGSVRQLAGARGRVTLARGYMPYGEAWWSEGQGSSAFGFAGEQFDAQTGLVYLRARYYTPALGQFLTEDIAPGNASLPRSLALYAYAWSNPVNLTDPSGLQIPPPAHGSEVRDLTGYLALAMSTHAQDARVFQIAELTSGGIWRWQSWASALDLFYLLEGPWQTWDIKRKMLQAFPDRGIVLCGDEGCEWYDYSTPGNIHFGYIAHFAGMPRDFTALVGGALQTKDCITLEGGPGLWAPPRFLGDDPQDQFAVDLGYRLAERYGPDVTADELKREIGWNQRTGLWDFQPPPSGFVPPYPAVPQLNLWYGPDKFNWP